MSKLFRARSLLTSENCYRYSIMRSLLLIVIAIFLTGYCASSFANPRIDSIHALEASSDGRIGISATNMSNNTHIQYRAEERFPVQSTFKVIGVGAILKQSMADDHLLEQKVIYKKQDLVFWSPITQRHLTEGMTFSELCAAAIMFSDNTATNLIVKKLDGPKAVTLFARSINDKTFRLDGWEPELNSNPNDLRDTSTPAAMEQSLKQLLLGNTLAAAQRKQLLIWMKENTTGNDRIRAGVPKSWIVADKTGSGDYGITNDIAIIWPPKCAPIVVSMYFIQNNKNASQRNDVIASATRILMNEFAQTDQCIKL